MLGIKEQPALPALEKLHPDIIGVFGPYKNAQKRTLKSPDSLRKGALAPPAIMAVEAAVVVFGLFEGVVDGDAFARRWLTKVCLDFRLHVVDGHYSADCLFYKKVTVRWLGNTVQTYARRWGVQTRSVGPR